MEDNKKLLINLEGLQRYHENLQVVFDSAGSAAEAYEAAKEYADGLNTAIETALAAETKARTDEDGRLAGLIASEAGTREGEMADMKAAYTEAIAAEATARTEADAAITATVEANKTAIEAALAAETKARTDEDGRLAGLIASEAGTREGEMADMKAAYTEAIAAEATARTEADAAMDERVSKLEEIDHDELVAEAIAAVVAGAESDFDTLKEVADWINSDTTGAAALQTTVSQHTESIAALETALAAEATARTEADAAITATVEANKTAIEAALADEATARTEEDARLAGLIASETGTREGEMADMKAAYIAADDEVRAYVDDKFVFATDADIDALFGDSDSN